MPESAKSEKDVFQADFCAERLKALGDPLRLKVIDILRHGEMSVGDIAEFLEAEIVNVSHHLKILRYAELVTTRREGRYIFYRLHEDLLESHQSSHQSLNLGCCKIEIPKQS